MVSIQRPLGYEPNTLPLRQSASSIRIITQTHTKPANDTPYTTTPNRMRALCPNRQSTPSTDSAFHSYARLMSDRIAAFLTFSLHRDKQQQQKACIIDVSDRCARFLGSSWVSIMAQQPFSFLGYEPNTLPLRQSASSIRIITQTHTKPANDTPYTTTPNRMRALCPNRQSTPSTDSAFHSYARLMSDRIAAFLTFSLHRDKQQQQKACIIDVSDRCARFLGSSWVSIMAQQPFSLVQP